MKLNEYLAKNAVKLMIKGSGEKNPTRQTNDLGMYDYVENLESVLGKSLVAGITGEVQFYIFISQINCFGRAVDRVDELCTSAHGIE